MLEGVQLALVKLYQRVQAGLLLLQGPQLVNPVPSRLQLPLQHAGPLARLLHNLLAPAFLPLEPLNSVPGLPQLPDYILLLLDQKDNPRLEMVLGLAL